MAEQHKKSKWGISSMLHKEKDRPGPTTDSTYGTSSEASSADPAARDSYTSAPSLTNSERSQGGYPGQQERQQTYVNDAGQTVTTTTTTTTTVTTGGGGKHDTSGPHTSNLANRLDPRVSSGSDYGNTEIKEVRREREVERPNIPAKSNMRVPSPNPPPHQQQQPSGRQAPQIQTHNMMRDRSPNLANPGSPDGRHNFSYPSRTPPPAQVGVPPQQNQYGGPQQGQYGAPHGAPQQQQPSTLQNLKTAAVGIHGVGETLRGTINSGVDKRFHASPETMAHNNQVLNAGRSEIQSGQLSDASRAAGGIGNPTKGILRKGHRGDGRDAQGLRVVNE